MVTFSRPVVIDTYTGDTEIEMLCDGEFVGSIRSESDEDGVHAYEVVFGYSDDDSKDKYFHVEDYGHSRTALVDARAYAFTTFLNREGA